MDYLVNDEQGATEDPIEIPIIRELRSAGIDVWNLSELVNAELPNADRALPVLRQWLRQVSDNETKAMLARALTKKWAKGDPETVIALIDEFRALPSFTFGSDVRWAIGNALEVVADERWLGELLSIARDNHYGMDRQMIVLGLGRMKDPAAVEALIDLLADKGVRLQALAGLRRQRGRAAKALPAVRSLCDSEDRAVAKEAQKTLKVLQSYQED